jgi:diguanylate cyclase (GGDEF)-like protein/PAS domain S-box-containing protein
MSLSNPSTSRLSPAPARRNAGFSAEERLRFVVELSREYYWELDAEGRFTTLLHGDAERREHASSRLLGKARWEIDGTPLEGSWNEHRAIIESRQPFDGFVVERPEPDGSPRYFESDGRARFDDDGRFLGYAGVTREITELIHERRLISLDRDLTELFTSGSTESPSRRALELICGRLQWASGTYWLVAEGRSAARAEAIVRFAATHDRGRAHYDKERNRLLSEALVRLACDFGDILWINELSATEDLRRFRQSGSALIIPVALRGKTIGAIEIRSSRIDVPSDKLKDFLRRFGAYLANVYERGFALRQLKESQELYSSTVELAAIGISHVAPDGRFLHANKQLQKMLGYSERELKSMTVRDVSHPDDRHFTDTMVERVALREMDSFTVEKRYLASDGRTLWVRINSVMKWGSNGEPLYHISTVEDISDRRKAEERVEFLATHDELTNLPNRAFFNEHLSRAIRSHKRSGARLAVLFLDLDRFKTINDSLGHETGDTLLREVADRIEACVRDSDCVARQGGDEFVLLLENVLSQQAVEDVARKLIESIHEPTQLNDHECRVTASIGIAMYPDHGKNGGVLTRNADVAMYCAKESGKNCWQVFSVNAEPMSVERLTLERHLQHALDQREFRIQYQPKVDARTGEIRGVEALLRWWNHELGIITPAQFIPVAEELGLIVPIGKWVLEEACAQSVAWQRAGHPRISMSVNLSPRQFNDPSLVSDIKSILEKTEMSPRLLELEITEGMLATNVDRAMEVAAELHNLGIRLAIDDFGTGYSSFAQLKRFPIDSLKIDRSFVRDLSTSDEDKAITEAIIAMGKSLGTNVVAEGVETESQREFLVSGNCDEIQGFLLGKPCHPDAIAGLLRKQRSGSN